MASVNKVDALSDINVEERSLVDRPANKRRFLLVKRDSSMDKLQGLTEAMEGLMGLVEILKNDPDNADADSLQKSLQGVTEKLTAVSEQFVPAATEPEATMPETNTEVATEETNSETPVAEVKPAEEVQAVSTPAEPAPAVTPTEDPQVLTVVPEVSVDQSEAIAKAIKDNEALIKKNQEIEKRLQEEIDRRELGEQITKVQKEYTNLPACTPEKLGAIFKSLSAKAPDELKDLEEILKAADSALGESKLYSEVAPQNGSEEVADSAYGEAERLANEMVSKSADLSKAQAMAKVWEKNPKLYDRYLSEGKVN